MKPLLNWNDFLESMRSASLPLPGVDDPSGVVENTSAPGISLLPGVPSTSAWIFAPAVRISVPSPAENITAPKASPSCTMVGVPPTVLFLWRPKEIVPQRLASAVPALMMLIIASLFVASI